MALPPPTPGSEKPLTVAGLTIQPSAVLTPEAKKIILGAAKLMLVRFKQKGLMPISAEYADLLRSAELMGRFMKAFRAKPDMAKDVLLDAKGGWIADDTTPTACGPTLGQVERMLVYTCASKVFAADGPVPTPAPGADPAAKPDPVLTPARQNLLNELKPYLAFDWQLALLEGYKQLKPDLVQTFGPDLLQIRQVVDLQGLAGADPIDVKKAKLVTEDRFLEMIKARAGAIPGLGLITKKSTFGIVSRVCGSRVWDFFAADRNMVIEALAQPSEWMACFGPNLADLSLPTINELKALPPDMLKGFMAVFLATFGADSGPLLADPKFGREILKPVVDSFRQARAAKGGAEDQAVRMAAELKWNALKPKVVSWLAQRKAGTI